MKFEWRNRLWYSTGKISSTTPSEFDRLVGPLLDGRADVVYGSRFCSNGPHRVMNYWHYVGNHVLTMVSNMFTNLKITDMETGYKAFRRGVLESIEIEEDRFGVEPEVTAKVASGRWRVFEVSISYSGRSRADGKHIGWREGIDALRCIVKYSPLVSRSQFPGAPSRRGSQRGPRSRVITEERPGLRR